MFLVLSNTAQRIAVYRAMRIKIKTSSDQLIQKRLQFSKHAIKACLDQYADTANCGHSKGHRQHAQGIVVGENGGLLFDRQSHHLHINIGEMRRNRVRLPYLSYGREVVNFCKLNIPVLAGAVQLLGSWKTASFCHHFVLHFSYCKERLKISIEELGVIENAEVDKRATV